mmetsp:Transcript_9261/g.24956  ORF Transcript_9261/g.24956 Transcript_9261/m.24956 type:complete len:201 (-) Transcript_9261:557-1159(-)
MPSCHLVDLREHPMRWQLPWWCCLRLCAAAQRAAVPLGHILAPISCKPMAAWMVQGMAQEMAFQMVRGMEQGGVLGHGNGRRKSQTAWKVQPLPLPLPRPLLPMWTTGVISISHRCISRMGVMMSPALQASTLLALLSSRRAPGSWRRCSGSCCTSASRSWRCRSGRRCSMRATHWQSLLAQNWQLTVHGPTLRLRYSQS